MSEVPNITQNIKKIYSYNQKDRSVAFKKQDRANYKLRYLPTHSMPRCLPRAKSKKPNMAQNSKNILKNNQEDHCMPLKSQERINCQLRCSKTYTCCICKKTLLNKSCFDIHLRIHEKEEYFICNVSQKQFLTWNEMKEHLEFHVNHIFVCNICQTLLSSKDGLEKHLRIHDGKKSYTNHANVFTCGFCQRTLSSIVSLKQHIRTHTGEKPYECHICHARYTTKINFRLHVLKHTGKPLKCEFCGKTFLHKYGLKVHLRIHTGEKPYGCEICEAKFTQQSGLNRHLQIHTEDSSFACNICMKSFSGKHCLYRHLNLHTKEKVYFCKICSKNYLFQSEFKAHLKSHAESEPIKFEEC